MTLFHSNGSWYMEDGQEVTLWQVIDWQEHDIQINVIESEVMD